MVYQAPGFRGDLEESEPVRREPEVGGCGVIVNLIG
jgi:hypothetical protein